MQVKCSGHCLVHRHDYFLREADILFAFFGNYGKTKELEKDLRRTEERLPVETFYVGKNTRVEHLELCDIRTERRAVGEMPLLRNCGVIDELCTQELYTSGDPLLVEEGVIGRKRER